MNRRQFLTVLGTASATALGGCVNGDTEPEPGTDTGPDDGGPPDDTPPDAAMRVSGQTAGPEDVVESFVMAAADGDPTAASALLHPAHPCHPDNRTEAVDFDTSLETLAADTIEFERRSADVTVETTFERVPGARAAYETEQLTDIFAGNESVFVRSTAASDDGALAYRWVLVSQAEGWRILWFEEESDDTEPAAFAARVVDSVQFDRDADRARVQLLAEPVADRVTLESANTDAYTSTGTPETVTSLSVALEPAGDAVVVRATVDGESRVVHRERYPPADRIVDGVTFDEPPVDGPFEGSVRVAFDDVESDGTLTVRSTRAEGKTSIEPASVARSLEVGADPVSDEVVVTLTEDGERTAIHRERHH
jgi:hypothetical protein